MPRIADLEARITADTGDFDRGMNRTRDGLNRFTGGMKDAGGGVSRFGGALQVFAGNILTKVVEGLLDAAKAVVRFGDECADAASDVSESVSKINTLFKGSAAEVDKWSRTTATSLGLSRRASLDAAGDYGNLFRAMEFGEEKSAQFSMRLVQMAADLSSFNNKDLSQSLEAIRSGLVGESEPLRAFGVNLNEATLKAEALKLGLVSTTKDALTPQMKALATMSVMTRQTAAAQGDFAKTATGTANAQRILTARLEDAKTKFGELVLPIKNEVIANLNSLMERVNRIDFKAAIAAVKGFIGEIVSGIAERVRPATDFFLAQWQKVVGWFQENLPLIRRTVETVLKFITDFWRDHGQQILAVTSAVWEQIKAVISFALDMILGVIKAAMQVINGDWEGLLQTLQGLFVRLMQFLKSSVENIGQYLISALTAILSGLADILGRVLTGLVGYLAAQIQNVGQLIGAGIANAIGIAFGERAKEIALAIGGWVGTVAEAARKKLLDILPGGKEETVVDASRFGAWAKGRRRDNRFAGHGGVKEAERRETPSDPWSRFTSRLGAAFSGGGASSVTMPALPSMGSLLKGVKATDTGLLGTDDGDAKKRKRDAERHAKEVIEARQGLADRIAELTLSEWDLQRRELNQYVAHYKKQTGDLAGARRLYALASAQIAKDEQQARLDNYHKGLKALDAIQDAEEKFRENARRNWKSVGEIAGNVLPQLMGVLTNVATGGKFALALAPDEGAEQSLKFHERVVAALQSAAVEQGKLTARTDESRLAWEMYHKSLENLDGVEKLNLQNLVAAKQQNALSAAIKATRDEMERFKARTPMQRMSLEIFGTADDMSLDATQHAQLGLLKKQRDWLARDKRRRDTMSEAFQGVSGENFLQAMAGGPGGIKRFWSDVVSTGQNALMKLGWSEIIQPQLKGLFAQMREGLNLSLSGLVSTAGMIINAAMGLMQAMQGGKRGKGALIGGILGGIAGSFLGPVGWKMGASVGSSLGGAIAGGNPGEILFAGLSGISAISPALRGAGGGGGGANEMISGQNLDARLRPVNQTINIGVISNAADLESVENRSAANLASAMRMPV